MLRVLAGLQQPFIFRRDDIMLKFSIVTRATDLLNFCQVIYIYIFFSSPSSDMSGQLYCISSFWLMACVAGLRRLCHLSSTKRFTPPNSRWVVSPRAELSPVMSRLWLRWLCLLEWGWKSWADLSVAVSV